MNSSVETPQEVSRIAGLGMVPESCLNDARKDNQRSILVELENIRATKLRRVFFADRSSTSLSLIHSTQVPRLAIPLEGCHSLDVIRRHRVVNVRPAPGDVVLIPAHAWNRPDPLSPAKMLNILFGANQITFSLIRYDGATEIPDELLRTSVATLSNGVAQPILNALLAYGADSEGPPLDRLLAEALLHACIRMVEGPPQHRHRKAAHTYEAICQYVQEDFRNPLTREAVALRFGLAPNHISRLFRQEGFMSFIDYLNMVRVSRAKFMLREQGLPLKAIATACGYQDTAYFCRVFKRICKLTPTEFRARYMGSGCSCPDSAPSFGFTSS